MTRHDDGGRLDAMVRMLARAHLEIERGLRRPDTLEPHMSGQAWQRWIRQRPPGALEGGRVQDSDIGTPQLTVSPGGRVTASIATRTSSGRWGALSLQLHAHQSRWLIIDLQRLHPAAAYHTGPQPPALPPPLPSARKLQFAQDDRLVVAAALAAAEARLADRHTNDAAKAAAAEAVRTWQRIIGRLDRELDGLQPRQQPPRTDRSRRR